MKKTLATIIVNRGKYYYKEADLKKDFLMSLAKNDTSCIEKFNLFFDEIAEKILSLNESPDDVDGMCTYIICEIIGVLIAMNIDEKDINSNMIKYFYDLDHVKNNKEKLDALRVACIKLIEFARENRTGPKYSNIINRSINYIENHINEKVFLKDLCKEINYSSSHLSHKFLQETGMSFGEYVRISKMEKARMMLLRDMSIDAVAEALSYSSTSHFINAFKKTYNITPKQFVKWVGANGISNI